MTQVLLAYYGDDFTGSTDALEAITRSGARAVLFLDVPMAEQLARFPEVDVVGVAGCTRSMAPEAMANELRPTLSALNALGAPHLHYKVCSTFDSSPEVGSIGRVIDEACELLGLRVVPVVGGVPPLGRYCVFGNLFAREGIGTENLPVRLDRLPAMQNHPVTPMRESDLRRHLSRQTEKTIGLLSVLDLELPSDQPQATLQRIVDEGHMIVLVDVLTDHQLERVGRLLDNLVQSGTTLFSVGSSAVEMALGAHWQRNGRLGSPPAWDQPTHNGPIIIASGSCSPVTAGQIDWALEHGFSEVALDAMAVAAGGDVGHVVNPAADDAVKALQKGSSVIVHTSRGKSDERVQATGESAQRLGTALGRVVERVLEACHVGRLCIAGGDTSSYVARQLGIEALEMIAPLAPGAPLCRVHAPGRPADRIEINVKGGQVGRPDYFQAVERGAQSESTSP